MVDFPLPDSPTKAVLPFLMFKLRLLKSGFSYWKVTLSKLIYSIFGIYRGPFSIRDFLSIMLKTLAPACVP